MLITCDNCEYTQNCAIKQILEWTPIHWAGNPPQPWYMLAESDNEPRVALHFTDDWGCTTFKANENNIEEQDGF